MRAAGLLAVVVTVVATAACKGEPDPTPWCSASLAQAPPPAFTPTYYRDVKPLVDAACVGCHQAGGIAPFSLQDPLEAIPAAEALAHSVETRAMPPFLAASCCTPYHNDWSLTDDEVALFSAWAAAGGPAGDPADEPPPLPPRAGLSRVDLTLTMPAPFLPIPPEGTTDLNRCFLIDWPLGEVKYVTGMNPRPGNRSIVHHITIAIAGADRAAELRERDSADPGPGFDCSAGDDLARGLTILGGGLIGGDFPEGVGKPVDPGSTVILQIHYSTARGTGVDQTSIDWRLDDTAKPFKMMVVANPAWLVDDGMKIEAGDPDAVFWYQYEPRLFTGNKRVWLRGVLPHMHAFGSRIVVRVVRESGERVCVLEIPAWEFGWTQSYTLAEPIVFDPGDELYVECHFDNSAANQPPGREPRDIAWGGNDQDMCAAFLHFTEEP